MSSDTSTPLQNEYAEYIVTNLEFIKSKCGPLLENPLIRNLSDSVTCILKSLSYHKENGLDMSHCFESYSDVEQEFRSLSSIFENWEKRNNQ